MRVNSIMLKILGAALSILILTAPAVADEGDFGDISDAEWQAGAPADYPEANAVILFDKAEMQVLQDRIELECHTRIKILTAAGADEVGEIAITYEKGGDKFKSFKAQTITPDGNKTKVDKDAIFVREIGGYKETVFTFPSMTPGAIVEYQYRLVSDNFYYLKPWYFQNDLYTMKSSFSASLYPGFTYNIQYLNVPMAYQNPVESDHLIAGNGTKNITMRTFTWTRENIPPVKDEPYMSAVNDYRSALRFQLYSYADQYNTLTFERDWGDLGKRFQNNYIDSYCNRDKEIKNLAKEITAGAATDRERSKAIFEYVKSNFAVSEEYQWYLFVHEKMSDLLETKYGSAEGLNLLIARMHQELGIPSWPVLISTREHGQVDPNSPDLRQFDYLITFVQLGNEWEFLDASARYLPYGLLPPACLTNAGLMIDGENSGLVQMTIKNLESARNDKIKIHINQDGTVTGQSHCSFSGYYASHFTDLYQDSKPEEFIKTNFAGCLGASYTLINHACQEDSLQRFLVDMEFTSDDMVEQLDNNLIIKPAAFSFRDNPFKSQKRFFPVDFSYPFVYRNEVEICCDGDFDKCVLPEDLTLGISGLSYARFSHVADSGIVVTSELTVSKPQISPDEYGLLREFFDKIARSYQDEVTFIMSSAR